MVNVPVVISEGEKNTCSPSNCALGQQENEEGDRKCHQELHGEVGQLCRLARMQCQDKVPPDSLHGQGTGTSHLCRQLGGHMSIQKCRKDEAESVQH